MLTSPPARAALRTLSIGGVGLVGVALLAGCGSGGGDGTATPEPPPGITAGGAVTLPDDVAVTRPPEEEPIVEPPAEDVVEEPVAEEEPIVEEPIVEEPIVEEPIVEEPIVEEPIVEEPIDDAVVWWPWALGLLLVVVAIVAVVVSRSRRGSADWNADASTAIDASDALTTHLLAIAPEGLVVVARADAQRLTDLDVTTRDLVRTAPDDRARSSIDGLRGPLLQLHAAVDMVALSPAPTPAQLALVHQWASALHVATSTARSTLVTPSS